MTFDGSKLIIMSYFHIALYNLHRLELEQVMFASPLSQCFSAAVHQQAHQAFTGRLPVAAMPLLGGQLPGAGHWAISGPLGRWRGRRGLAGFIRLPLTWLPLGLSEGRKGEEEEEEEGARQDLHCGWRKKFSWAKGKKVNFLSPCI